MGYPEGLLVAGPDRLSMHSMHAYVSPASQFPFVSPSAHIHLPKPQHTAHSLLARAIEVVLITTVVLNTINLIIATYPIGQFQPASCPDPLCSPPQCPQVICAPVEKWSNLYINAAVAAIFTVDYFARL